MLLFNPISGYWVNTNKPGGRVYFVGGGTTAAKGKTGTGITASDTNDGQDPTRPLSTISQAHTLARAGAGDTIVLLPGSITVTAAIAITKADLTLMGYTPVQPGDYCPSIITAAATYDLNVIQVDADNVTIDGIGFEAGFTTVTANQEVVQVNSTNTTTSIFGCVIQNCFFDMTRAAGAASASDTDLDVIRVGLDSNDSAINSTVRGCTIKGYDQDGIVIAAGSTGCVIENNRIYDGVGSELGRMGVSILAVGAIVRNNWIYAGTTSDTAGPISVGVATARAVITDNHLVAWGADTVGITAIDTATFHSARNYIHAVAAGNIIDYKVSATVPSSNIDWGNVEGTNPTIGVLVTATVAGT